MGKLKGYGLVAEWTRSIINHLYWCVHSSDNGDVTLAKWLSISNHIVNKHKGHGNPLYPDCSHPLLKKKWFKAGIQIKH